MRKGCEIAQISPNLKRQVYLPAPEKELLVPLWQKETKMKIITKFSCHLNDIGQIMAFRYLLIQSPINHLRYEVSQQDQLCTKNSP